MDKARILVVEDELPIQTLIAFNLQEAGFDVCCAQNVQAAPTSCAPACPI